MGGKSREFGHVKSKASGYLDPPPPARHGRLPTDSLYRFLWIVLLQGGNFTKRRSIHTHTQTAQPVQ